MPTLTIPDGAPLREFNPCHDPRDGKFSSRATGKCAQWGPVAASSGHRYARRSHEDAVALVKRHATTEIEREHADLLAQTERRINAALAHGDTASRYTNSDGTYTEARRALHVEIVTQLLTAKAIPQGIAKPVMVMTGGLPGSGKTTAAASDLKLDDKLYVNSDDIKQKLPGYEGWNAVLYHRESEEIAGLLLDTAARLRMNIVFDYTMKSAHAAARRVEMFKARGYRVEARFVDVPVNRSVAGAIGRFVRGMQRNGKGRYVHPDYIRSHEVMHQGRKTTRSRLAFDRVRHRLDAYLIVDNDVPKGQKAKVLGKHGTLTEANDCLGATI